MPIGLIGRQLQAASHERDRLVNVPLLVRRHARVVQRIRVLRHHVERTLANHTRIAGATFLQPLDGEGDRLVQAECRGLVHPVLLVLMS